MIGSPLTRYSDPFPKTGSTSINGLRGNLSSDTPLYDQLVTTFCQYPPEVSGHIPSISGQDRPIHSMTDHR